MQVWLVETEIWLVETEIFVLVEQYHMTRRAFLSSKSNTGAGEIQIKRTCQKVRYLAQKNENFSESMNSFDSASIFPSSLDHYLSRNRFVVSVYAF